ncbi:MAG: gliding motility-associated ABC transporter substrate-binding protein GldG [Bacteroidetes bacterium]|nr:gliding motility-associated ABC transporter substrate-binding protein GldG [Bacteroidota bacterium]MCB9226386.1 gliding motility-associated ABC transporter substrate-binding protein GldG [Chitinophagales bacterium]
MKAIKKHINTVIVLVILLVLNIISSKIYKRFDLTEEKRYSISNSTKDFLKNLDDVVTIRVYLTGNLPSGMKELEKSIETTLNEFKAYAGSNLQYTFVDLSKYDKKTQEEEGKILYKKGLTPINLTVVENGEQTQRVIFPGAVISYKGRTISTNLLENKVGADQFDILNNSIVLLEYKFANSIQKLQRTHPPLVAFSTGHGEVTQENLGEAIQELQSKQFAVSTIDLTVGYKIDAMVDVLVIPNPTQKFNEKEKYKIDQYLMRGGKIIWLLDHMAVNMDSLNGKDFFLANARDVNLTDMLFKYGARINDDLILDLQNTRLQIQTGMANNQPQMQWFNWPYFNLMIGNSGNPASRNLAPITGSFTSSIDTIKNKNVQKEILLTSSEYSKALFAPVRVYIGMVKDQLNPAIFQQKNIPTGVYLSGQFESVFDDRAFAGAYAEMTDTIDDLKYIDVSSPNAKMIVVSDGDLITNKKARGKTLPVGYATYGNENKPMVFDNLPFFMNCVEYLLDDNKLINTRSKEIKLRQLDATKVKESKKSIQIQNLLYPLIAILIFAFAYGFIRKRTYAK